MPNGLITPGLVLEVAEASKDNVITPEEFGSIILLIGEIFIGIFTFTITIVLLKNISKGSVK